MRQTISILFASLAISLSGYLSWRIWNPYLAGHWEIVYAPLNEYDSGPDWIETLDITRDNVVYLNYDPGNLNPAIGEVSRLFRRMYIGPSCLSLNLKYYTDGNTLHLEVPNYEEPSKPYQLTAIRSFKCIHWKPKY